MHSGHQRRAKGPIAVEKILYMLIHALLRKIMIIIIKGQLTAMWAVSSKSLSSLQDVYAKETAGHQGSRNFMSLACSKATVWKQNDKGSSAN